MERIIEYGNNWYVEWLRENNLTRPEVYRHFGVPIRTQENWSYNNNSKPNYVFNLLLNTVMTDNAHINGRIVRHLLFSDNSVFSTQFPDYSLFIHVIYGRYSLYKLAGELLIVRLPNLTIKIEGLKIFKRIFPTLPQSKGE